MRPQKILRRTLLICMIWPQGHQQTITMWPQPQKSLPNCTTTFLIQKPLRRIRIILGSGSLIPERLRETLDSTKRPHLPQDPCMLKQIMKTLFQDKLSMALNPVLLCTPRPHQALRAEFIVLLDQVSPPGTLVYTEKLLLEHLIQLGNP